MPSLSVLTLPQALLDTLFTLIRHEHQGIFRRCSSPTSLQLCSIHTRTLKAMKVCSSIPERIEAEPGRCAATCTTLHSLMHLRFAHAIERLRRPTHLISSSAHFVVSMLKRLTNTKRAEKTIIYSPTCFLKEAHFFLALSSEG